MWVGRLLARNSGNGRPPPTRCARDAAVGAVEIAGTIQLQHGLISARGDTYEDPKAALEAEAASLMYSRVSGLDAKGL